MKGIYYLLLEKYIEDTRPVAIRATVAELCSVADKVRGDSGGAIDFTGFEIVQFENGNPKKRCLYWDGKDRRLEWEEVR